MDTRALQAALAHLGLALPYGLLPGSYPGGVVEVATDEATWQAYRWNPPEYMRAGALYRIGPWRALRLTPHPRNPGALYNEFAYLDAAFTAGPPAPPARTRIATAYVGTPNRIEEITWRLNGRATAAQDAERARLVAACHALERRIGEAATIEALEAIDVSSDAAWTADDGGNDGDER